MKFIWQEWDPASAPRACGHGSLYVDGRKRGSASLVGWLKGYDWLHGNPQTVVILCARPDSITARGDLDAMRVAVESHIVGKKVPSGAITPHIFAIANA